MRLDAVHDPCQGASDLLGRHLLGLHVQEPSQDIISVTQLWSKARL